LNIASLVIIENKSMVKVNKRKKTIIDSLYNLYNLGSGFDKMSKETAQFENTILNTLQYLGFDIEMI